MGKFLDMEANVCVSLESSLGERKPIEDTELEEKTVANKEEA